MSFLHRVRISSLLIQYTLSVCTCIILIMNEKKAINIIYCVQYTHNQQQNPPCFIHFGSVSFGPRNFCDSHCVLYLSYFCQYYECKKRVRSAMQVPMTTISTYETFFRLSHLRNVFRLWFRLSPLTNMHCTFFGFDQHLQTLFRLSHLRNVFRLPGNRPPILLSKRINVSQFLNTY